jgi:hypothetical protein
MHRAGHRSEIVLRRCGCVLAIGPPAPLPAAADGNKYLEVELTEFKVVDDIDDSEFADP